MRYIATALLAALVPFGFAQAAVTLSAGESAVFNFDLTGATPAPPFLGVNITPQFADYSGDVFFSQVFSDLNGSGTEVASLANFVLQAGFGGLPGMVDGLFSLRVTSTQGTFSLNPFASGLFRDGQQVLRETEPAFGTLAAVPAPATLALLGIGLAGLGIARRRKTQ